MCIDVVCMYCRMQIYLVLSEINQCPAHRVQTVVLWSAAMSDGSISTPHLNIPITLVTTRYYQLTSPCHAGGSAPRPRSRILFLLTLPFSLLCPGPGLLKRQLLYRVPKALELFAKGPVEPGVVRVHPKLIAVAPAVIRSVPASECAAAAVHHYRFLMERGPTPTAPSDANVYIALQQV